MPTKRLKNKARGNFAFFSFYLFKRISLVCFCLLFFYCGIETLSQKHVLQVFEQYQKERKKFGQTVAELATRPQNIETLQNADVMLILRPLLLDVFPTALQPAALVLGKLASYNNDLAEAVLRGEILHQLIYFLAKKKRFYKKAVAFVLCTVAKHSPELTQAVVDCGGLEALVISLEVFHPKVKDAAAWALGNITCHNGSLAQAVVDAGAVPLLVLCMQEPEIALKRIFASTLSDISRHSPELAQTVVDTGAIAHLAQMSLHPDAKLKCQISKHSVDLAEMVVEAEIFPAVLACLKVPDECVKQNDSTLKREITKHTPELSQTIVKAGGVAAVNNFLWDSRRNKQLPGIMMLGYMAAQLANLAMAVIVSKAATAWTLGQINHHTPKHARALAMSDVLPKLLCQRLQVKVKKALKSVLQKCTYLPALEPLLYEAAKNVLKHIMCQFSKVLSHDSKARRLFVTSGGLKKVQEIKAEPGSALLVYINAINACFPKKMFNCSEHPCLAVLLSAVVLGWRIRSRRALRGKCCHGWIRLFPVPAGFDLSCVSMVVFLIYTCCLMSVFLCPKQVLVCVSVFLGFHVFLF
ncbi:sperm-associated antigen 6-like [Tachysurus fulvidraco]|uniref:sperm-associated antigen 6-like n=1 Tax=Tachysurus fulvidraco TaxID=1234273 RepID=UPI001FEE7666|nr:sperm-associated antigen 6-like [Tachysurus fulvidraco]